MFLPPPSDSQSDLEKIKAWYEESERKRRQRVHQAELDAIARLPPDVSGAARPPDELPVGPTEQQLLAMDGDITDHSAAMIPSFRDFPEVDRQVIGMEPSVHTAGCFILLRGRGSKSAGSDYPDYVQGVIRSDRELTSQHGCEFYVNRLAYRRSQIRFFVAYDEYKKRHGLCH